MSNEGSDRPIMRTVDDLIDLDGSHETEPQVGGWAPDPDALQYNDKPMEAPLPCGPETLEVSKPGGIFSPAFEAKPRKDWQDRVDDAALLCQRCKHAWKLWKHAPVIGTRPDGSPIMEREGYCMFPATFVGGAPLPLEMRYVLECNRFEAIEEK